MGNLVVRRKSRTLLYSMALLAALTVAPMEASAFQATQVYQPISEIQQDIKVVRVVLMLAGTERNADTVARAKKIVNIFRRLITLLCPARIGP